MGELRVRIWGQGVQISLEDHKWLHISLERPVQTQTLASNWTLLNVVPAALCAVRKKITWQAWNMVEGATERFVASVLPGTLYHSLKGMHSIT